MPGTKIENVTKFIQFAGGRIVGRTRLQKIAYLLTATGLDDNFRFSYKHYGPFSEELASSAKIGALFGDLNEKIEDASWGGTYSTYTVDKNDVVDSNSPCHALASLAAATSSIELELAATAVFLAHDGYPDPWGETKQRKPEKATVDRLKDAKDFLSKVADIPTPAPIPATVFANSTCLS